MAYLFNSISEKGFNVYVKAEFYQDFDKIYADLLFNTWTDIERKVFFLGVEILEIFISHSS